eukprot:7383912-Prymnesium_polylepis.1
MVKLKGEELARAGASRALMAMAKMAGDTDSEGGCDEGARAASSVHLAAEGGERAGERSWMKLRFP